MPTLVTKTVKSAGGDYSSLSAWEAGEQGDLVSADEIRRAECYAFQDTSICNISGWTTDSTRYPEIVVAAGEGHAGVLDLTKYRLSPTNGFTQMLTLGADYARVTGIQVYPRHATSGNGISPAATGTQIHQCLVTRQSAGHAQGIIFSSGGLDGVVRNTIVYGWDKGIEQNNAATGATFDNVTCVNNATFGFRLTYNTPANTVLRNCYSGGNGIDDYSDVLGNETQSWAYSTCMSSDAFVRSGVTASVPCSTANFTNVTAGSEDFHLVSGSALRGAGTDLSGDFTVDIDGDTRSAWDIGADEYVVAGGGPTPIVASDAASLTASDALALLVSLARTDAATLASTEAAAVLASLTRTDTLSVTATEASPALLVTLSRAETVALLAGEAVSIAVTLAAADTAAAASTEAATTVILTLKVASDTAALQGTEGAVAIRAELERVDTAAAAAADVVATPIVVTLTRADQATLVAGELAALLNAFTRTDAATVSASELATVIAALSTSDSLALTAALTAVIVTTTAGSAYLIVFTNEALAAPARISGESLSGPASVSGERLE